MDRSELRVPMFCPVCKMVMKGSKSVSSYYNFKCCNNCFIEFVEGREQRWNDGWRPNDEQIERFFQKISSNTND